MCIVIKCCVYFGQCKLKNVNLTFSQLLPTIGLQWLTTQVHHLLQYNMKKNWFMNLWFHMTNITMNLTNWRHDDIYSMAIATYFPKWRQNVAQYGQHSSYLINIHKQTRHEIRKNEHLVTTECKIKHTLWPLGQIWINVC
jgi:hypothetical protein